MTAESQDYILSKNGKSKIVACFYVITFKYFLIAKRYFNISTTVNKLNFLR